MATSTGTATIRSATGELPALSSWSQLGIVGPLALLAIEVGILSPQVEFKSGAMMYLAHPLSANLILVATVLFLILAANGLRTDAGSQWSWHRVFWFGVNVVSFVLLFCLAVWLQDQPTGDSPWMAYVGWGFLTLAVGVSGWLAFVPLGVLFRWLTGYWEKAIGSLILALTLVLCTPDIRRLWYAVYMPVERMTAVMLQIAGYNDIHGISSRTGNPIIGAVDGIRLEVTPNCSEMESLAAFILVSGVLLFAGWHLIYRLRFCVVVLAGLTLLYCLSAFRLFFLIDIASRLDDSGIAVRLAHSRISQVLFLAASLLIWFGTRRWWYRGSHLPAEAALQTNEN